MKKLKQFTILSFILLNLACVSFSKPTEITYLIPEGFTGGVIIVFNQPDGITPETTQDGTIIFRVPKDGLIKVKQPLEKTVYKLNYYFVDEKGNKTRIEYLHPQYSVKNPNDPSWRNTDEVTEEESKNEVFASDYRTTNFNVSKGRVYINSFIIEKPIIALDTLLKTIDKIFDIQIELLKKESSATKQQK